MRHVRGKTFALLARPQECPEEIWLQIVEAEKKSREKKFGSVAAALGNVGLDKAAIEANQLRIWEELKKRKDSPELKISETKKGETPEGPFASLRTAWQKMYEEADRQGYAQAVALSANLENKGLLPKVVTANSEDTSSKSISSSKRDANKKKQQRKKKRYGANTTKGFAKSPDGE
eukprot:CAMPEP_0197287108 /NCGR_PEP_ID=MMETSP0890-20130614/3160_1 /TAXON_ID=44058 ORGANISM="Aureoumbra lagunensis, Strain CCMP1510" /NCGR_SAMPLE_ID=MMETSP0890 /ASSEMBLY_ACC=CAM_ASM_000533 /LENGTH=175 /DNA_ID=CAMNT_0042756369 /DNA_START=150 /DNA_END=677 /DNA_ORIENTATION=-